MSDLRQGPQPDDLAVRAELDAECRSALMAWATIATFAQGERIQSAREASDAFYLLLEGRVEITSVLDAAGERRLRLTVLQPGDSFGEVGVLDARQQGDEVCALTQVRALRITSADWQRARDERPQEALTLSRLFLLSHRNRVRHAELAMVTLSEVTRIALDGAPLTDLLRETLRALQFFCALDAAVAFLVNPYSSGLDATVGVGRPSFLEGFRPKETGELQRFELVPSLRSALAGGVAALEGEEARAWLRAAFGCVSNDCVGLLRVPLLDAGTERGLLVLLDLEGEVSWPRDAVTILEVVSAVVAGAVTRAHHIEIERARERFERLRERI